MNLRRSRRPAVILYGTCWAVAVTAWLTFAALRGSASQATIVGAAVLADAKAVKTDPAKVVGASACVECHKAEHARWMKTVHYTNHKRLTTPNAVKYGKTLGIAAADVPKTSLCINCHATPKATDGKPTAVAAVGVSCESCHGGAGGTKGWLKPHGDYGGKDKTRRTEIATHRQERLKTCREAGKVGPRELYGVAKKCFACHIVDNEKLVNAGHKAGSLGFEFASWSNGEVRHNFQLDQSKNAPASSLWLNPVVKVKGKRTAEDRRRKMYVLGLMVDLETSLRNRANATTPGYAGQMAARIGPMQGKFAQINVAAGTAETKTVAALIPPLFANLFAVNPGDKKLFGAAADKVAKAAKEFMDNHDGTKLTGLDKMKLIPEPHYSKDYKK